MPYVNGEWLSDHQVEEKKREEIEKNKPKLKRPVLIKHTSTVADAEKWVMTWDPVAAARADEVLVPDEDCKFLPGHGERPKTPGDRYNERDNYDEMREFLERRFPVENSHLFEDMDCHPTHVVDLTSKHRGAGEQVYYVTKLPILSELDGSTEELAGKLMRRAAPLLVPIGCLRSASERLAAGIVAHKLKTKERGFDYRIVKYSQREARSLARGVAQRGVSQVKYGHMGSSEVRSVTWALTREVAGLIDEIPGVRLNWWEPNNLETAMERCMALWKFWKIHTGKKFVRSQDVLNGARALRDYFPGAIKKGGLKADFVRMLKGELRVKQARK